MGISSIKKAFKDYYIMPKMRGAIDADELCNSLSFLSLLKKKGFALKNVNVPTANGKTTKTDVIYITEKGIFVVKCVNQVGFIKGDDASRHWSASIFFNEGSSLQKPEQKLTFDNPVIQNDFDAGALKRFIDIDAPIFSMLVFPNEAEFKEIRLEKIKCCICHVQSFTGHIKRIWQVVPDALLFSECNELYNKLRPLSEDAMVK